MGGLVSKITDDVLGFDPNGGGIYKVANDVLGSTIADDILGLDPSGGGIVPVINTGANIAGNYLLGQAIGGVVGDVFGDGGVSAAADADIAGGMVPEFGTNAAYDTAMQSAMTPAAAAAIESAYINPVVDSKVDYSLFGDSTSAPVLPDMGAQGLQVPVNTSVADNVGYSPVDYSLTPSVPFEGLQMPTSPNLDVMGGGQGLTYQTPEGVFSQEGLTPTGTALDLGDPNSFINNPAAIDQAIAASSSPEIPKAVQEALFKQLAGLFAGGLAASAASQPTQAYMPPPAYRPQDTTPTYSPEYFQQMQNYYTGYMPNMPRDVATPLQDWYNTGYTGEDSVTKKLFGV